MDGISIDQQVEIEAPLEKLLALIADPQRYTAIEPRLKSARWLDGEAPQQGAQVELVTDIPFTVPLVQHWIGSPHGVMTLTEWRLPSRFACRFEAATVVAEIAVRIEQRGHAQIVDLQGVLLPKSRLVRWLFRPARRRLEHLTARSVQRGAARLESSLRRTLDTEGPSRRAPSP